MDCRRVLVIEYKGALLAHDPAGQQEKLIGELWAERSHERHLFDWVENIQSAGHSFQSTPSDV